MTSKQLNRRLSAFMPFVVPSAILIGVMFPGGISGLLPAIPAVFFVIVFAGSATLRAKSIMDTLRHPLPLFLILGILHIVMPALAWAVAHVGFPGKPDIAAGIVLEFLVPTARAGFAWIAICAGDLTLGLVAVFVDAVLAPLLIPLGVDVLMGAHVTVDSTELMRSMVMMILIPALLAVGFNEATRGKVSGRIIPVLQIIVKVGIVLVILASATRIAPIVRTLDPALIVITVVMFVISLVGYVLGWVAAHMAGRERATTVAMIYGSGMRNINAGAVIAAAFFPEATMFPVIISTLFQQVTAALFALVIRKYLPESPEPDDG